MASEGYTALEKTTKVDGSSDNSYKPRTHEVENSERTALFGPYGDKDKTASLSSDGEDPPKSAADQTYIYIYCSHFLSAWGDRMWSFGVGLFLVRIAGNSLQLPASYGLASGLAIFLLGALVGDWVDSTPRLKAAQFSLVAQNVLVIICSGAVYFFLEKESTIMAVPGGWAVPLCHVFVILTAVIADLASVARVIAVERDWIVKICDTDNDMLAKMTATLRRIDQLTLVLAPIATGEVMTAAGLQNGALFIGAWNLGSVAIEYYLMWKVYTTVPALATKEPVAIGDESVLESQSMTEDETSSGFVTDTETPASASDEESRLWLDHNADQPYAHGKKSAADGCFTRFRQTRCGHIMLDQFVSTYEGWHAFMSYNVALAGLALACLFMTVLGFDNITVAYAITQGLSEATLGILMAVSAVFGMLGTFVYPYLRRRIGLVRTGMHSVTCQLVCLSLCVASIWLPGSPFDPTFSHQYNDTTGLASIQNMTGDHPENYTDQSPVAVDKEGPNSSIMSVTVLMTGIVLSRFGLYMSDLSITQLFLEAVVEKERGVVNGVQNALNKLMDVLKFLLVVFVPYTQTFGFLIIISFVFILSAWIQYAIFHYRERGHFFHCWPCGNRAKYQQF